MPDQQSPSSRPPARPPSPWWPLVAGVVALTLLLAAAAIYVTRTLASIPGQVAEGGRSVVREVESVARAFNTGTVHHLFLSYATAIEGTLRLQVARLEQVEVYELRDEASTLWGALELPAVAVRATAPVEYTYFVDLDGEWQLELRGDHVLVLAPSIRWNKPAIDASAIHYEVRQGSLVRDERKVLAQLKRELTGRSAITARRNTELVRETARRQVETFVSGWLLRTFDDAREYDVDVYFEDELPAWEARIASG